MTSITKQQCVDGQDEDVVGASAAFNIVISESVLVFDACKTDGPQLSGAVRLDASLPPEEAAKHSKEYSLDYLGPDNTSIAVVLDDGDERGQRVAAWLTREGHRVVRSTRECFQQRYPFLLGKDYPDLPTYPSEIIPDQLFLGGSAAVNEQSCADLRITHICSVTDRAVNHEATEGRQHIICNVQDTSSANLTPTMLQALPFIRGAVEEGGRVLVHCEKGQSRSASVVAAHLLEQQESEAAGNPPVDNRIQEVLTFMRRSRPFVRPNPGFMQQLHARAWVAN